MKPAAKVNPMDTLRQLPENKKCFDCQQKVSHSPQSKPLSVTHYWFAPCRVPCTAS